MDTGQNEPASNDVTPSASGATPNSTIYEMIEESSYLVLENHSTKLLALVTELVRTGNSPEEIVAFFMEQTGIPRWRVAYLGCAAAYIQKINSVAVAGGVS